MFEKTEITMTCDFGDSVNKLYDEIFGMITYEELEQLVLRDKKTGEQIEFQRVVHCKDCRYYTANIADPNLRKIFCDYPDIGNFCQRNPEDFCSRGERV